MQIDLINFSKNFGQTRVIEDLNLTIKSGEMIALLGPSGCGKSTTLLSICGIHRLSSGKVLFGGEAVEHLAPQERNVGVVFQNYALYPHMTIAENIAFPLKIRRMSRAACEAAVEAIARMVRITELLERRPAELSGGQQQRVALARALVRQPDVLLLDEPLANLDAKLRLDMRSEIRRLQQDSGLTAILVTHDQIEAMSMCDRIALMNRGNIVQVTQPMELYHHPKNRFVADFIGTPPISIVPAQALGQISGQKSAGGDVYEWGIRPEFFGPQHGTGVQGKISYVEQQGREDLIDVVLDGGALLRSLQPNGCYRAGQQVNWGLAREGLLAFDRKGDRL